MEKKNRPEKKEKLYLIGTEDEDFISAVPFQCDCLTEVSMVYNQGRQDMIDFLPTREEIKTIVLEHIYNPGETINSITKRLGLDKEGE